jgi:hypothetical protein
MHYIDQICVRLPAFTLRSLTVHRIVITAIALSSKALCDAFCTNTHYARVGGLPPLELARLEMDFLHAIDWRLVVSAPRRESLPSVPMPHVHRADTYALARVPAAHVPPRLIPARLFPF